MGLLLDILLPLDLNIVALEEVAAVRVSHLGLVGGIRHLLALPYLLLNERGRGPSFRRRMQLVNLGFLSSLLLLGGSRASRLFLLLGGPLSCLLAATVGIGTLVAAHPV